MALGEVERRAEVVVLALEHGEPGRLLPIGEVGLGLDREREGPRGEPAFDRRSLAGLVQTFAGELADRLQHRASDLAGGEVGPANEARVEEPAQHVEHVEVFTRDRLDRLQGAAAGEHRQASEQGPRVVVEQVVAPRDRRRQRLLAFGSVARAAGEHRESSREAVGERVGAQQRHAARRQLERERQAVERRHDAGDGGRRSLVQLETRVHGGGPFGEQTNGVERRRCRRCRRQARASAAGRSGARRPPGAACGSSRAP